VANGNLMRRMDEMGFDADLVRWVERVMEERKVIMSMDGKERDSMDVQVEVPQRSPVWPVRFILYLSGLFDKADEREEQLGSKGISFVHDVAWVEEGEDVGECTQRLQRCAMETLIWANKNACQFDIEKPEAILFTG